MTAPLKGRVALVTGAARGQGRAHALTLARAGADVIAVDIGQQVASVPYPMAAPDDLDATVKEVESTGAKVIGQLADVRSQEDLDAAVTMGVERFGRVDILIANAGIWGLAPFWELSEQQWSEMIDINLAGVWRSAKAVAPYLIEQKSGAIVMTSSTNGLEPGAQYAHYTSAKYGVIGLMKTVALELAPYGVRCNAVCPSLIDTGMTNWQGALDLFAGKPGAGAEQLNIAGNSHHALANAGALSAQVVADAAMWLVSDQASWVTGVAIPVDAGHLLLQGSNAGSGF